MSECPLCGNRKPAPGFFPPLLRCGECELVFRDAASADTDFALRAWRPDDDPRVQERRSALYAEFLARHRPLPGRDRLLDVGCGTGEFLRRARDAGWEVLGVEIAEASAVQARQKGLPVLTGSLARHGLPEASFSVVTFWNVLDFVPDPVAEVREAKRVLAPGGVLVLRVGNLAFHSAVYRLQRLLGRWPRLALPLARQYVFHQVSFSAQTLRRTLERGGFERIEVTNAPPTRGDPYRTLPRGGDRLLQALKLTVHGLAQLVSTCSGGKLLLGSSLLARAVKEDGHG